MFDREIIERFLELFSGREDVFAVRREFGGGRAMYVPTNFVPNSDDDDKREKQEATREWLDEVLNDIGEDYLGENAVAAHLEGDYLLGVYPLRADSKTRFFAFDIDGKKADPWEATKEQYYVLIEEAELPVYIERSQSGNGYHIWGFLSEPMDAGIVRKALKPFIEKSEVFDRMYPVQPGLVGDMTLGNLIALPLHGGRVNEGNSVFVEIGENENPEEIEDQHDFIFDIQTIPTTIIKALADSVPEDWDQDNGEMKERTEPPESLGGFYKMTHPKYGCEFVNWCYDYADELSEPLWYALACNFAQLKNGRELFHEWSKQDKKRYRVKSTDSKFDNAISANKPHTCNTIRELGGECRCDERFPRVVTHPYDLVKLPFKTLVDSVVDDDQEKFIITGAEGIDDAIEWAKEVEKDPSKGRGYDLGIEGTYDYLGARDSDLIILAGRPGSGKTSASLYIANSLVSRGIPVYFASVEMAKDQLYRKLLVIRAGVPFDKLKKGQLNKDDWDKINAARIPDKSKYPLFVDDTSKSVDQIFEALAHLVYTHGKGVIVLDYLQLLQRLKGENEQDLVTRAVIAAKTLAKAVDCPFLALSQLNRAADEATETTEPSFSWLRSSGYQEQTADVILYLLGKEAPGIVKRTLYIKKERFGEAGHRIPLDFDQARGLWVPHGTLVSVPEGVVKRSSLPTFDKPHLEEDDDLWEGLD